MRARFSSPAVAATLAVGLAACSGGGSSTSTPGTGGAVSSASSSSVSEPSGLPFAVTSVGEFDSPWAMTFLPGGSSALITERTGALKLVDTPTGRSQTVGGVPKVVVEGQGGLGDIIVGPTFARDRMVYLSWVEAGDGGTGAVVGRARLVEGGSPRLEGLSVIWRQTPKVSGSGHFSHRLVFSPDGRYLFVSSGERQKGSPAQDRSSTLGKIMRMAPDGSGAQVWSLGHRNPLGLAFDSHGTLWSTEMGPKGGDELNVIRQGANYGWPRVSNGSNYDGSDIPDHKPGDGYEAPKVWWNPSISPSSLMIYSGSAFPQYDGDAFVGALSGQALIRVHLSRTNATKADQWDMGHRIREVEQGPDGTIWLLEDGAGGRLLHLTKP